MNKQTILILNSTSNFILDLIFPKKCLSCNQFSDIYLCNECQKVISEIERYYCVFCGDQSPFTNICDKCQKKKKYHLDQCLAVTTYKNPVVQKIVSNYKYKFITEISSIISNHLNRYLSLLQDKRAIDISENIIIPVPLHPRRLRWRGFNQSEIISEIIANDFNIKLLKDNLVRIKHKIPQVEVESKEKRQINVKDIFDIKNDMEIKDKNIILIDDITTTGSTLNECAKQLKKYGAKRVIGLVFAIS